MEMSMEQLQNDTDTR